MAYTSRVPARTAAQTGLSCFVLLRVRVLRPLPRRDLRRVHLRTGAPQAWPSPRHDRLGSRIVTLSRLQASRDVAARGLAPSVEALDTPLGPRKSPHASGVCYSALRRLPRRDLHPREKNDTMTALARSHHHDAPCFKCTLTGRGDSRHGLLSRHRANPPRSHRDTEKTKYSL